MAGGFAQGEAIERLAQYEDMCEELQAQQQALALQMEKLRAEGREKSVKFRELFAQKLTNAAFLSMLQAGTSLKAGVPEESLRHACFLPVWLCI